MKLFIFDVETTGLSTSIYSIYQLAFSLWVDGEKVESFNCRFRPHYTDVMDPKALALQNLSPDQVKAFTPTSKHVFKQVGEILKKHVDAFDRNDKMVLCAYNAHFDESHLRQWWIQNSDKYFGSMFWSGRICLLSAAMQKLAPVRHKMPNFKLSTVAEHLGVEIVQEKLHDAEYDLLLTEIVAQELNIIQPLKTKA